MIPDADYKKKNALKGPINSFFLPKLLGLWRKLKGKRDYKQADIVRFLKAAANPPLRSFIHNNKVKDDAAMRQWLLRHSKKLRQSNSQGRVVSSLTTVVRRRSCLPVQVRTSTEATAMKTKKKLLPIRQVCERYADVCSRTISRWEKDEALGFRDQKNPRPPLLGRERT